MITMNPVSLTGQPQTVSFTSVVQQQDGPFRVANESPYALQIQFLGDTRWLDPWTADIFTPSGSITAIQVTPFVLIPITGAPATSLLITLAVPGETFPGTYPMALTRQVAGTVVATDNPETLLSTLTIPRNTTTTKTITVDSSIQGLIFNVIGPDPSFQNVTVRGVQTGTLYFFANNVSPLVFDDPVSFGIHPSVDQSYTFGFNYSGGTGNDTWFVGGATSPRWPFAHIWAPTPSGQDLMVGCDPIPGIPNPAAQLFVSTRFATPAVWQNANKVVDVNLNPLNNGSSFTILSAVSGQTPYLFTVHIGYALVNAALTIETGAGRVLWRGTFNNSTNPAGEDSSFDTPMGGVPGDVGSSLVLFNRTGSNIGVFGSICVNQG